MKTWEAPHFVTITARSVSLKSLAKQIDFLINGFHLASPKAQKIKKVWNNKPALVEVIKYGSKIFTEPDVNNKTNKKQRRDIYTAALDNIFCAMKGHRVFDRFGFNLPKLKKKERLHY